MPLVLEGVVCRRWWVEGFRMRELHRPASMTAQGSPLLAKHIAQETRVAADESDPSEERVGLR